ncbi:MAG: hypothetical protein EZS28_048840, partial [Streblomastix strix]
MTEMDSQDQQPTVGNEPSETQTKSVKPNLEEKHPFILNLFYCFFMPFVCRVKPVTDED